MLKLIIVDDESMTRQGLSEWIASENPEIEVVGEAEDGIKGLELALEKKPDIILSDIRMPRMNGIELASAIKEALPDSKIIFLSGYSDKDYLKSAIKIQVVDYIEKPIDTEEMSKVIKNTAAVCMREKKKKESEEEIKNNYERNIPLVKQSLVADLCNSNISMDVLKEKYDFSKLNFHLKGGFVSIVIKIGLDGMDTGENREACKSKILKLAEQFLAAQAVYYVAAYNDCEELVIYVSGFDADNACTIGITADNLMKHINVTFSGALSAGIGKFVYDAGEIRESYATALETARGKFSPGCSGINFYKEVSMTVRQVIKLIEEHYNENLTIRYIADSVYLTPTYLCALFKRQTRKTINEYIEEIRVEKAKCLLNDRRIKLYEVASIVGYKNPNYFTRVFKKLVGVNPSEFREKSLL